MISASIVLYNSSREDIDRVICSYSPCDVRHLYIIDNSDTPNIEYSKYDEYIEYIFVGKNIGYGAAHNIGIRRAVELKSKYHIVLNPDILFESSILDELIQFADNDESVVYILPKVVYPNGEIQYLCKLLPTPFDLFARRFLPPVGLFKRLNDKYVLKETGYCEIMNPPCLSGCFMFMRTSVFEDGNGFDERFFMYCEDFDLIRRLHRVGKTIYYPYVTITHNHARESYKSMKMLLFHIRSACRYFNKYGWIFDKERKEINANWR